MAKPNFEATFRRLLKEFECAEAKNTLENPYGFHEGNQQVEEKREKVVRMFRHHANLAQKYRTVLNKIQNETMDPPMQELAQKALTWK